MDWADRIVQARKKAGLTQQQLADAVGVGQSTVGQWEKAKNEPSLEFFRRVAAATGSSPEWLAFGVGPGGKVIVVPGVQKGAEGLKARAKAGEGEGKVPEIDVRGGMGAGGVAGWQYEPGDDGTPQEADHVTGLWELPPAYLRQVLRVRPGDGRIIEVQGDSMDPTLLPGDRVMVNTFDRTPSPPGIFALWDGLGVVVKRVEFIPNTDPLRFVISSDNPKHERYERTADELNVIGRVVWFARKM